MKEKKGKDFILGHFYTILNLEVGRKSMSFPVSSGCQPGGGSGWTYAYTCANNSQYLKSMWEEISTLI
jgi:hypothetical protein